MADCTTCSSECGCQCSQCDRHELQLHREIEALKQRVIERDFHILRLETNVLREAERYPHGEVGELRSQLGQWQDKYDRLLEAHKKLQRVNQNLEDKLLRIVDKYETDKAALSQDVANLTTHLVSARTELNRHRDLSERYRSDLHLAIQLLQCKPSTFISRRLETLPVDLQQKVKSCLNSHQKEQQQRKPDFKVIRVPISTFPPTAMVYAVDKAGEAEPPPEPDVAEDERVSAAILARVLEERERERSAGCSCGAGGLGPRLVDVSCQTQPTHIGDRDAVCQPFVFEPGGRRGGGADPEPAALRQTVVIGRPRPARPVSGEPAPWWPAAEPAADPAVWDNNFDFSPPRSRAESHRTESVSSSESMSAASAGALSAAALRMETRI
ncbi:tight junction-associated protein 1-like isoform X1 [Amphibalanus amphitrite]|uniref:tight junction-associated protein 1-like isoform X1 n=1 Tax=Amphibalanus amphitrite TaxID=1232801 RepID=UPI001C917FE5|nr:tight junction-associated protein 1-like isoform X1 [Amphibalanus amphitrite]